MQGEHTESSIIAALDRIYQHVGYFDVVVIVRGGGSSAELSSFDSYTLASHCAQFPLPIISGIGHERDDTVVDLVAHTRLKTPTAVAAYLIDCMEQQHEQVYFLQQQICAHVRSTLTTHTHVYQSQATRILLATRRYIEKTQHQLHYFENKLLAVRPRIAAQKNTLSKMVHQLQQCTHAQLGFCMRDLALYEQFLKMAAPEYTLKRGYSLIVKQGKIVKQATQLEAGDEITIRLADGTRKGKITS